MIRRNRLIGIVIFLLSFTLLAPTGQFTLGSQELAPTSLLAGVALPELVVRASARGLRATSTIPAGPTLVSFANDGVSEMDVQFASLPSGYGADDLSGMMATNGPPPAWFYETTWAGAVPRIGGGEVGHAVIDFQPGEWVVVGLGQTDGLETVSFTVTGDAPAIELDIPTHLAVTMRSGLYDFPLRVEAGRQVWTITNGDERPHAMTILAYPGQLTAEQAESALRTLHGDGQLTVDGSSYPIQPVANLGYLSAGSTTWVEVELHYGMTYIVASFAYDDGETEPQCLQGMFDVFVTPRAHAPIPREPFW